MAKAHIRFDEDIKHYEPSDSETEYTEREKTLLKKVQTKTPKESDSEEEVYGLHVQDSDDDESNESDVAESDIENENDYMPDARAWGQTKRAFYSTDYVDPDYGGHQGKDAMAADQEEEEARIIQQRLAQQLDDEDFGLDIFNKKNEIATVDAEEVVKTDLSNLSKRQILELLQKESPEFFELVQDFKMKMEEVKNYLLPVIELNRIGKIPNCEALDFVKTKYHLTLNYCTNIYMYLLLKASKVNVQNHPVVTRLFQYRQLIAQIQPIFVEIMKPQIEILTELHKEMEDNEQSIITKKISRKSRKLKLFDKLESEAKKKKELVNVSTESPIVQQVTKSILKTDKSSEKKHISFELRQPDEQVTKNGITTANSESDEEKKDDDEHNMEDSKRAITYQMAKNKGLISHRKKEQRNPRVKHRNKYRKAKIRRKGAVREVKKELSRYGGEMSGIKMSVTKSIKFK